MRTLCSLLALAKGRAGFGGVRVGLGLGQRCDNRHPAESGSVQSARAFTSVARLAGSAKNHLERGFHRALIRPGRSRMPIVAMGSGDRSLTLFPSRVGDEPPLIRHGAGVHLV